MLIRHRWFAKADREVMAFVCPETQRVQLESEDPLEASIQFVRRARQLGAWTKEQIDPYTLTPESVDEPIESAREAISIMADTFTPATGAASRYQRECYGTLALNCNKLAAGRDVMSRIDTATLNRARKDYFRHRADLAKAFAREGAPLAAMKTCED